MSATEISRRELARQLGADEKALRNWEQRPDAPKTRDLAEWQAYVEANHLAKGMTRKSYAELRELKIAEEIELLRLKKAKEEGRMIALDDVREYLGRLGAKWDQLLTQKIEIEMPARLLGKDIVAARAEARAVHDEIRDICNAGLVGAEKEMAK